MKILTLTTLYPNAADPTHGVFVENRMRAFVRRSGDEVRVIAPVPWFPSAAPVFGKYARFAGAPASEVRHGISVDHPRYLLPPKVGMTFAAESLERCFAAAAARQLAQGWDFDLIDAHYLYPDGVAAARVARALRKPLILTARGTDVSFIPRFARQRRMILEAVHQADTVVCVAAALKDELVRLGAPAQKLEVLRNGVDLDLFCPRDRVAIRAGMGLEGPVIASVGHLIDRKGHDLAIEATARVHGATLLIVGDGEERARLEGLSRARGLTTRVRFLGRLPHASLPDIYSAADVLVLASSREGWPNVLLEAMACGTPAVAAPIWGCGEVITEPAAGRLAASRDAGDIADAVGAVLRSGASRAATRTYAERFSWEDTSRRLGGIFMTSAQRARARAAIIKTPLKVATGGGAPRLLFTVDTEEEFDWSGFGDKRHKISRPEDIDRLQTMLGAAGVRPLYFVTYPILKDGASARYFRGLIDSGAADAGLHMHQWNTPPASEFGGEYYSWQANLPADVYRLKLASLARAFRDAFGQGAIAHRAGRYGISLEACAMLSEAGVRFDFSPSPGFDFSPHGGPDFSAMSNLPFTVQLPGGAPVHSTPVSGGIALRGGSIFLRQTGPAGFDMTAPKRTARRRIGRLSAGLRLTCEQARLSELKALTRRLLDDGAPILTFSLHSTTLSPGGNPYAVDRPAIDGMLDVVAQYLDYFTRDLGGRIIDLGELGRLYDAAEPSRKSDVHP